MGKKHKRFRHTHTNKLVILLALIVAIIIAAWSIQQFTSQQNISIRKERILAIYESLKLDDTYKKTGERIFGEKRLYSSDPHRSYSSERHYVRDTSVDVTVADTRKSIESSGFTYIGEPYAGSVTIQYHFKNDRGEYIRISVSSKTRDDAFGDKNTPPNIDYGIDPNSAPSNVVIRVNLDDNNE